MYGRFLAYCTELSESLHHVTFVMQQPHLKPETGVSTLSDLSHKYSSLRIGPKQWHLQWPHLFLTDPVCPQVEASDGNWFML